MSSTLKAIYIASGKKSTIKELSSAELRAGCGIVGDRYFDSAARDLIDQITLIDEQEIERFLRANGRELEFGQMRRNLLISGSDLPKLVGKQFQLGAVTLVGTEMAEPCASLVRSLGKDDTEARSFFKQLTGKTGIRARILTSGTIKVGDSLNT